MRRCLCIVLALLMVSSLLVLASCAKPSDAPKSNITSLKYVGDSKLRKRFESFATIQEILDDVSVIDLKHEMNVTGLEKQTEEDEENSTSIDYYYRNQERIYAVYNGYGENVWKYFTTSKSGVPIVASFWDEGDGPRVTIETNEEATGLTYEYKVSYQNVSTDFGNGAEQIDIAITKGEESCVSTIIGNYYFISSATYWDDSKIDLHLYQAQFNADTKKVEYQYDKVIISSKLPELTSDEISIKRVGTSASSLAEVDILLGKHVVYKDQDGKMSISADTTLVFKDEDAASRALRSLKAASVKADDFTIEDYGDGEAFLIDIGTCYFEMSSDFEDADTVLTEYAMSEFDDYVYKTVDLDRNGNIKSFEYSTISYY